MDNKVKILQIMPAPAGMSVYYETENNGEWEAPVVCLALVEGDGVRNVVPVTMDDFGEVRIATDQPDFMGVLFNDAHISREGLE